ncbi:MAG: 5-(carboxyamino)imidazole ribonucleotide synthase [Candidatus Diapherotrites archaeon]|nr:5-(carboxyamino)imidazole ribonucleotide synthase [Candidatus Diapherotrites archaeon]
MQVLSLQFQGVGEWERIGIETTNDFPRLGIIGGGQLGKMLASSAKRMGLQVTVLDPMPQCPAFGVSDDQIVADFMDESALRALASQSDCLTFEFDEAANSQALKELSATGYPVHPSPETLYITQSKVRQKTFLRGQGLPVPAFVVVQSQEDVCHALQEFNGHAMLKQSQGAYDGRGNWELQGFKDLDGLEGRLNGKEFFVEEWVSFEKELSVMVARNEQGDIATYPVAENIHKESILDTTIVPARIPQDSRKKAEDLARKTMESLNGSGVFGIEMFLTENNEVLINEIAPRVHNSGHYTLEACKTSQFNQHVRAILNWPLGSTQQIFPAVMVNILGKSQGPFHLNGLSRILQIEGAYLHIYGKKESRPRRKMGHVTVIDEDLNAALAKAERVKRIILEEVH